MRIEPDHLCGMCTDEENKRGCYYQTTDEESKHDPETNCDVLLLENFCLIVQLLRVQASLFQSLVVLDAFHAG